MQITTIGLDIAKRVFQVHGADVSGKGRDAPPNAARVQTLPGASPGATRERCSLTHAPTQRAATRRCSVFSLAC